ncbi:adenylate kinase [archaeon]|nr:adenylate kinase [archaeon]|tara:strand:+ start:1349 stop:1993 length:645 start_codon:yes stop_codon:yes gene_type:complete
MNIILIGGPSVGKGTYATRLKKIYNIPHISTGDLFRENINNQTELGKTAQGYIDQGNLVPDEVTIEMVKDRLSKEDAQNGYLLDGFPRTIPQAQALEEFTKVDKVLSFTAEESVILSRIAGRRICKGCGAIFHLKNLPPKQEGICDKCGEELYQRPDEKEEAVKQRLETFHNVTKPVLEFYKEKGLLAEIDANLDINNSNFHVIEDCQEVLNKL